MTKRQKIYLKIKRKLDIVISFTALLVSSPLLLAITLAVKLDSRGPVLFLQKRVGQNKEYFYIYKFRTMKIDAPKDVATHLLGDSSRYMTRVGRLIRRVGLDELPQLFNILKGDMSLVGPRPALWNQFDLIEERERLGVHTVPMGLTGWAQLQMERREIEVKEKAKLDGYYVRHFGFRMDAVCVFRTIKMLFHQMKLALAEKQRGSM